MEWSSKYMYIGLLMFYLAGTMVYGQVVFTVSPSEEVRVGTVVTLICSLPVGNKHDMVMWESKHGNLTHNFGTDTLIREGYNKEKRYSIMKEDNGKGGVNLTLTIKNAKAEDTAKLGCKMQSTKRVVWTTLAVCEDVSSSVCKCVSSHGWHNPTCFKPPQGVIDEAHAIARRTAIGLGVCLGIAIAYGVVVTFIVFWDCTQRIAEKRKRSMPQSSGMQRQSYDDSQRLELDPNETESQTDSNYGSQETRSSASQNNPAFRLDEDARQPRPMGEAPPKYIDLQRQDERQERALYPDARNGELRAGGHHQGALSPFTTDSSRDGQPAPRQRGRRGQFTDHSPQKQTSDVEVHRPMDRSGNSASHLDHSPGGFNRSRDRGYSAESYGTPDRLGSPNSASNFPFPPRQEESGPGAFTPVKPGEYMPRTPASAYSVGQPTPRTPDTPASAGNVYENTRGARHDRNPYRNAYDNSGSMNGYSRSQYDDFPSNRSGHSEPRRLEFRDLPSNRAPSPKHNGPYIDKTNTVV